MSQTADLLTSMMDAVANAVRKRGMGLTFSFEELHSIYGGPVPSVDVLALLAEFETEFCKEMAPPFLWTKVALARGDEGLSGIFVEL